MIFISLSEPIHSGFHNELFGSITNMANFLFATRYRYGIRNGVI